jgi:hypothetical protein
LSKAAENITGSRWLSGCILFSAFLTDSIIEPKNMILRQGFVTWEANEYTEDVFADAEGVRRDGKYCCCLFFFA